MTREAITVGSTPETGSWADVVAATSPDSAAAEEIRHAEPSRLRRPRASTGPGCATSSPTNTNWSGPPRHQLLTDEGDSWAAHWTALNPTSARRRLNELVDPMIDPIEDVTAALADRGDGVEFDMHETMVEATLRVVANALFSQDFGPLVGSMNDLATRGMRRAEKLERLGLGVRAAHVRRAGVGHLAGVPLPPPLREGQQISLELDKAVNAVIADRLAHPTDSADLLNVLLRSDNGASARGSATRR